MFHSGEVYPEEVMANLSRLQKWVVELSSTMRNKLEIYDKRTVLGLEFNLCTRCQYTKLCTMKFYNELKKDLDNRVELLKLAVKRNEEFTVDGIYVPLVSTTPRKSSITIK
jgi:hypothetical protein